METTCELLTFVCAECGETFTSDIEDEKAWEEAKRRFGPGLKREDCKLVCMHCYPLMAPVH
jgi:hypothetical protein